MATESWTEIAAKYREKVAAQLPPGWRLPEDLLKTISAENPIDVTSVPSTCGLLTSKELEITEQYDAVALVEKMVAKELTSEEVTLAFCKRAAIAKQVTNCLTEMFFDKALERAKFLDSYLEKEGKPFGPLHGLPISLKDSFNVKGVPSTLGYVAWIKNGPSAIDSTLVQILLSQGAVLYVKTNIPQTLMAADSVNNVFGRVLNPHNLTLSAGGSSGGEGALIAMKGSVLGVGTDIAGSVRIPALCNGLLGFRPSASRVPYGGQVCPGTTAEFGINSVAGPLARSARDLKLFLETVTNVDPWKLDYTALNIPWRPVAKKDALRVGVIVECPSWKVSPPAVRTITSAVSKLTQAGHSTIMLQHFPSFKEARELAWGIFDLDNETTNFKYIAESGEPWVQPIIDLWSPPPGGRPRRTLEELFELEAKQSSVKAQWHKIFVENDLDVIVAPGVQHGTAVPHDKYGYPPYTSMWNVVNYPACIIPYLQADKNIDVADEKFPDYDPEAVDKAPCHIQVIAPSYHDEELMAAVELIEKVLGE